MPNLETLLDMVAEKLHGELGKAWYLSVDMTYKYSQIPLQLLTAKHCNFQVFGGESTGTYRFVTEFFMVRWLCRQNFKKYRICY